jgi:hypothetical protein
MPSAHRVRHLSPLLWAFVCALMLRVGLPAGIMVAPTGQGGPVITLCSGTGMVEAVRDGDRLKPAHGKSGSGRVETACPFAGGHAFTATPVFEAPVPTTVAWDAPVVPPPAARAPALRLRAPPPPSHAPPVLLS